MQAYRVGVVLNLLGERVGQPCEPAYPRLHSEVLSLDVASRDVAGIGVTDHDPDVSPGVRTRAAVLFRILRTEYAVNFDELGEVDAVGPQRVGNGRVVR